jgi:hypothetical protein
MPAIKPTNMTAQLLHAARGNPPSVLAEAAISNCFPGLELDFRNLWKNLFEGIELHEAGLGESGHRVVGVDAGSAAAQAGVVVFSRLVSVDGISLEGFLEEPSQPTNRTTALELGNALAAVFARQGAAVQCVFDNGAGQVVSVGLRVRRVLEAGGVPEALAEPGALTQSLCSPWQADYRECGCYYWAASRPDFVNVDAAGAGQDWMQRDRAPGAAYAADQGGRSPDTHITYEDLYRAWETHLRFIIAGRDSE